MWEVPWPRPGTRSSSGAATTGWWPAPTWPGRGPGWWSWRPRSKTGGAAATDAPWPEAPKIKVTRLSYVMSLMPPSIIRDLELERHGYKLFPMGPAYQAWPDGRSLTIYDDDARRNHEQIAKFSKQEGRRRHAPLGRLAGGPGVGPGAAAHPGPAQDRLPTAVGSTRAAPAGLALQGPGRAHRRRRDPAHDHERQRPAGRLVRVRAGQGEPGHQRGDRHLGRARLARDRLRDGPPLDR